MAAEIGLVSVTQIQNNLSTSQLHKNHPPPSPPPLQQQNPNSSTTAAPSTWMWNPREQQEQDESWEVRAFAEDTKNIMGTTWPPRSYTCTFCRREFRSAQALGGHMNVHRRDRARLHQAHPVAAVGSILNKTNHPILIETSHPPPVISMAGEEAQCVHYHLPNPNNGSGGHYSPSNILSISLTPYLLQNNLMKQSFHPSESAVVGINAAAASSSSSSYYYSSIKVEEAATSLAKNNGHHEELDLELRLGHRP